MTTAPIPFRDLPVRRRLWLGACGGAAFGVFVPLIVLIAVLGGRYQVLGGDVETDVWALAALYPVGAVVGGVVAALCGRLWRNRWTAALAAALSAWPLMAAISVAEGPRGPTPYDVDWAFSAVVALCFGVAMPFGYDRALRRGEAHARAAIDRHRPAA